MGAPVRSPLRRLEMRRRAEMIARLARWTAAAAKDFVTSCAKKGETNFARGCEESF